MNRTIRYAPAIATSAEKQKRNDARRADVGVAFEQGTSYTAPSGAAWVESGAPTDGGRCALAISPAP
ncbi:hypothetical protein P7B03_00860 [Lysobacter soli]|nr:hypothetical protein [Lysobacter soli]